MTCTGSVEPPEPKYDPVPPAAENRFALASAARLPRAIGNRSVGTSSSIHSEPRSGYSMLTDSCTTRPTSAAFAAATTAAEPSIRMRSLSRQARRSINLLIGGIAVARLMTASWPLNACTSANESNKDARTGVAPWAMSTADFSGERASALMVCPSACRGRGRSRMSSTPQLAGRCWSWITCRFSLPL